ncbi:HlyD family secretion protein [Pseudomonas putida]|uniref:efflux RND transporter periplasmic adaptor subunit n=1 Tax=Pseudomonas sp. B14(2017) TaxID=1981745 RepID=UPI000A1DA24A|nr:HlyD family secretion protein [Pseudomonas sp. B14(2017)]EKT4464907.1 HlyD family secretion protein [Pseudomonas putida]
MTRKLRKLLPFIPSLLLAAIAIPVAVHLWDYYSNSPWTRDGRVRAEVVQVAPDVAGLITQVAVEDNQLVKRGQLLFRIDRSRYEALVKQAQANLMQARANLGQAQRQARRNHVVSDLVARQQLEEGDTRVERAQAALAAAEAVLTLAQVDLVRTEVRSPVDGYVNDQVPRSGDYITTGRPVLSIVDEHSLHVVGYFEETKLERLHIGQPVEIRLMGSNGLLHGHVQSVAAGIDDRDRSSGEALLPNVNPAFNWVRLAQRVPVRVALDDVPGDLRMVAGRTATVSVRQELAR